MNENRELYIMEQVKRHNLELHKRHPEWEIFGIFLQGSQNYGLDIYTDEYKSDVDTKAIIVPSLEDIVLNKKPISTTLVLDNNEHIDVKDIRLMFENFKKQNINFLEILFTKFKIINATYIDQWEFLKENRELIAHYNTNQAFRCMAGMSKEKKKALCHPYPSIKDKIEKYGYDGKQLHHIIRMYNFITCYGLNGTFEESLTFFIPGQKDEMLKAKLNEYSLEEAIKKAEHYDFLTNYIKNLSTKKPDKINQQALDVLHKVQYETIKIKMIKDIKEDEKYKIKEGE